MPISPETLETGRRLVARYPVARSAVLPLLHLAQSEEGYVTDDAIGFAAELVGLSRAEVGAVATFYTMFKREPVGDWLLSVCTNPPCKLAGGQEILDGYLEELGGHHDHDGGVSVEHAECLGICDGAPVVQINYEMFGPMTVAEGAELLAACRRGEPPTSPWSGERPPTFSEVEYDLSGANDAWEDQLHLAARQQVTHDTPPMYRSGETDIPVTAAGGDPMGVGGAHFRTQGGAAPARGAPTPAGSEIGTEFGAATVQDAPASHEEVRSVGGTGDAPTTGADTGPAADDAAAREYDTTGPNAAMSDEPGGDPRDDASDDPTSGADPVVESGTSGQEDVGEGGVEPLDADTADTTDEEDS